MLKFRQFLQLGNETSIRYKMCGKSKFVTVIDRQPTQGNQITKNSQA